MENRESSLKGTQSAGKTSQARGGENNRLGDGRVPGIFQPTQGRTPRAAFRGGRGARHVLASHAHHPRPREGQNLGQHTPRRVSWSGSLYCQQFAPARVRSLG